MKGSSQQTPLIIHGVRKQKAEEQCPRFRKAMLRVGAKGCLCWPRAAGQGCTTLWHDDACTVPTFQGKQQRLPHLVETAKEFATSESVPYAAAWLGHWGNTCEIGHGIYNDLVRLPVSLLV